MVGAAADDDDDDVDDDDLKVDSLVWRKYSLYLHRSLHSIAVVN